MRPHSVVGGGIVWFLTLNHILEWYKAALAFLGEICLNFFKLDYYEAAESISIELGLRIFKPLV